MFSNFLSYIEVWIHNHVSLAAKILKVKYFPQGSEFLMRIRDMDPLMYGRVYGRLGRY
jgi:hypothetical protein